MKIKKFTGKTEEAEMLFDTEVANVEPFLDMENG